MAEDEGGWQTYQPPTNAPAGGSDSWESYKPPLTKSEIAADVAKSAGTGVIQGGIGIAGLPGDVAGYLNRGIDWGLQQAGFETQPPPQEPLLGSSQIRRGVEAAMGAPLYEPQTSYGRSARNIADVATQSAVFGPWRGALYAGAGSEALGKAAETFAPSLEPYARAAGAIVGGARGSYTSERKAADAARMQLVSEEAPWGTKQLYRQFDQAAAGQPVDPVMVTSAKDQMRRALNQLPYETDTAEKLVNKFSPQLVPDLGSWRQGMRETLFKKGEAQSANALTGVVDRMIEQSLPQGHVGVGMLQAADRQFAITKLAQALDKRITTAEFGTWATHSGANLDNKVRQALQSFKSDTRSWHSLTEQDRARIDSIINGNFPVNALRTVANFLGGGGGMGAMVAGLVGHQIVPGYGFATPLVGGTLKHFENRMTENAARNLLASVAGRSMFAVDQLAPSRLRLSPFPWRAGRAAIYGGLAPQVTSEGYPYYQAR